MQKHTFLFLKMHTCTHAICTPVCEMHVNAHYVANIIMIKNDKTKGGKRRPCENESYTLSKFRFCNHDSNSCLITKFAYVQGDLALLLFLYFIFVVPLEGIR